MKPKSKTTKRERQIKYIMNHYYYNDNPKYWESNLRYLQSLNEDELEKLYITAGGKQFKIKLL